MTEINLQVRPQPKQWEAIRILYEYPIVFFGGAKGGGKSKLVRDWQLMRRLKHPNTTGVIIRKTYMELSGNHIEKMWQEYPELRQYYNESQKVIKFPNGSKLYFRHLSASGDVYNYQGTEYEDIALDECTQHSEEVFRILRSSNRTINPNIKPKFLLTGNPGGIGHGWVKRLFVDRQFLEGENPDDYAFIQAKVQDNKVLMDSDPGYLMRLENLPPDKKKAYLEGDWDVFEGQFFNEWRTAVHVISPRYTLDKAPENFEYRLGWDDGTRNPRAVELLAQDNDGRVEVIWEYYKTDETVETAAINIKSQLQTAGIYELLLKRCKLIYDPSMNIKSNQSGIATSQIVSDILGIPMISGNNDRLEGARRFKSYLHWDVLDEPLMRFWNACPNIIRTVPQLIYRGDGVEDIDSDSDDHCYDSARYALMSFSRLPERFKGTKFQTGILKSNSIKKKKSIWDR